MFSMTGWGAAKTPKYTINLRGLNSKYKEVLMHVPQEFLSAEPFMYKYINEKISRGRVDVYVNVEKSMIKKKLKLNEELFKSSYRAFTKMAKNAGVKSEVLADTVLNNVDGIIVMEDAESKTAFSWETIKPVADKAVKDFMKMKAIEGKNLAVDIEKRAAGIQKNADKVKVLFKKFKKDYSEKATVKIDKILSKEQKSGFLNTEIVEVLDKHNITEELVRIGSHIKQLKTILKSTGNVGRKIDFLAQELYREINTIASKIYDSEVSHCVISMKENTEKIREQAMNLE